MIKIKISELTVGANDVSTEGTIVEKGDVRDVNTRFGQKKVCKLVMEDDTGRIDFSVWEDDIEKVKEGDKVSISGGYVTEWNSKLQLNIPRSGSFEVKE